MMKKVIGLALVLCVAVPAASGALVDDKWNGTVGNWTDTTWNNTTPWEGLNESSNTCRVIIDNSGTVTVNTNVTPTDVGVVGLQVNKGTLIIDDEGYLKSNDKTYVSSGTGAVATLQVKDGGTFKCINASQKFTVPTRLPARQATSSSMRAVRLRLLTPVSAMRTAAAPRPAILR